ncbi:uncharacterized protein ASCRUDRAFT_113448 [Ascoidea rubescens DSM 1968]|uniref:Uncharacterized protein n=1 Tax=Ascoidea rubescens DSM 1968 TaxID=1344418 RepID=A0A1D2VCB3_9ASCO|nr:hypothetical protein ASCRUDRAFT_113448 [Ascoidea rubescens DSM 1968]ODV59180.1 hypothetical protein ASCRUDRAFT_113448 [Ascoidea rubescens DSM 1968]
MSHLTVEGERSYHRTLIQDALYQYRNDVIQYRSFEDIAIELEELVFVHEQKRITDFYLLKCHEIVFFVENYISTLLPNLLKRVMKDEFQLADLVNKSKEIVLFEELKRDRTMSFQKNSKSNKNSKNSNQRQYGFRTYNNDYVDNPQANIDFGSHFLNTNKLSSALLSNCSQRLLSCSYLNATQQLIINTNYLASMVLKPGTRLDCLFCCGKKCCSNYCTRPNRRSRTASTSPSVDLWCSCLKCGETWTARYARDEACFSL